MSRALGSLCAALAFCAWDCQAQFSTNLWPTTNVFRFATNAVQVVSNVPLLVFHETNTEWRANGSTQFTTTFFRQLDASPWAAATQSWERATNYYEMVAGVDTNTDPFGDPVYTGLVWAVTSYTYRAWATNTPTLHLQARDLVCWESWQAMVERDLAVPPALLSTTSAPPAFYRSMRENLIAQKTWIENRAGDFVIPTGASNLLAAGSNALPRWTAAGLLASNSLPADYLTNTPQRALIGEGTNSYGYNGIRACLTNLVWTDAEAVWTNGLGLERQGYSYIPESGGIYGYYTNWADAVLDEPAAGVATNGDLVTPRRSSAGAMADDGLPFAYAASRAHWNAFIHGPSGTVFEADLWLRAEPGGRFGGALVWDDNGDFWADGVQVGTQNVKALTVTKPAGTNTIESAAVPAGGGMAEGAAPAEPTGGEPYTGRGWVTAWAYWVLRWDVTNGFRFK